MHCCGTRWPVRQGGDRQLRDAYQGVPAAPRAAGDVLVLETLFFADEVRDPHQEIGNLPGRVDLPDRELRMASQLIEAMGGRWDPADYRDTYTDRVNELIDAKRRNQEFRSAKPASAATNVTDLTQALQASLDAARKPRAKTAT